MSTKILSVTFEINAQNHDEGQFTVPKKICDLLKINDKSKVLIEIKGKKIATKLGSGTEVYGPEFKKLIKAGERIIVTISPE